jgi:hypothetical protein
VKQICSVAGISEQRKVWLDMLVSVMYHLPWRGSQSYSPPLEASRHIEVGQQWAAASKSNGCPIQWITLHSSFGVSFVFFQSYALELEPTQYQKVTPLRTENFSFWIVSLHHGERSGSAS